MSHLGARDVQAKLNHSIIQEVLRELGVERFQSGGPENWLVSAPYRQDSHPSCSIQRESGVFNDHATGEAGDIFELVAKTMNLSFPEAIEFVAKAGGIYPGTNDMTVGSSDRKGKHVPAEAEYSYVDEDGKLLYTVHRKLGKEFYVLNASGDPGYGSRRVLYRLPDVLNAGARWILFVEGEKDVDRLRLAGFVATTSPGGSNSWNDRYGYVNSLRGRRVAILIDNDEPGRKYGQSVADSLTGVAKEVRLIELPGLGPRLPKGGKDVSDWLDAGSNAEELRDLIRSASPWQRSTTPAATSTGPALIIKSMQEVESRPINWIWRRWLARGKIHLLGGHAGEGKSLLTAAIAAQMSNGAELPDGQRVTPIRTLFLLAEDDVADTVKPRLEKHDASMASVFFIEAVREPDRPRAMFSIRRHLELLEDAIRAHQIDVLIVDPLSAFLQGSERNSEEVRDLLTPLADLAAQTNIAILGIMHIGKPTGTHRRPLQQLLGVTAFGAVARIVWMLAAGEDDGDENLRVLGVVKSNIAFKPPSCSMRISESGAVTWIGESDRDVSDMLRDRGRQSSSVSPERQAIIDLLSDSPVPLSPQEIANHLNKNVNTARNMLRRMEDAGDVVRPRTGIYTTPSQIYLDSVDSIDTESTESTSSALGETMDSHYRSVRTCTCGERSYRRVVDGPDVCANCGKAAA